jgi:predicted HicB family RNase H-like nuclease
MTATSNPSNDDMPEEIDFSGGERGKFYRPGATFNLPVYLDAPVREYLTARAQAKGVPLNELVNQLLKKDIELIEAGR